MAYCATCNHCLRHFAVKTTYRYFARIDNNSSKNQLLVDSTWYVQAFQEEYTFGQKQHLTGQIPATLTKGLYQEINQVQSLQLQQLACF